MFLHFMQGGAYVESAPNRAPKKRRTAKSAAAGIPGNRTRAARVCASPAVAPLSSASPSAAYVEQAAGGAVTAAVPLAEAAVPLAVVNREGRRAPPEPLAVMKAA